MQTNEKISFELDIECHAQQREYCFSNRLLQGLKKRETRDRTLNEVKVINRVRSNEKNERKQVETGAASAAGGRSAAI